MAVSGKSTFEWPDYLVFSLMLAISSIIALLFAIKAKRKHAGADDMLTGSRSLPIIPVAMSLSASFVSATTILGIPAEVYSNGGELWLWCLGVAFSFTITAAFILPFFHKLQLTNAYEYLELRFNRVIRYMGSIAFSFTILVYMAAVLYAPAVALSQVTGLSSVISILVMGAVCAVYTSIGGIRAVVWTDAFQLLVIWAGLLALMFKGANDVGGWTQVWEISRNGSRLPVFNMDPNPFIRHTFWTVVVGGGVTLTTIYGASQSNLQRYASVRTLNGSRLALMLCLPMWVIYLTVLSLLGLVMYAYFEKCDPITTKGVASKDQLVPFFVLETMGGYPGMPGLFVACIFSASISTISSGINSLAAVTMEDIFKPCFNYFKKQPPTKTISTITTIALVNFYGALSIALAYTASLLGKTALVISFSVFGIVGGPLLALLMSGMFIPFMNSWGAGIGMIASLLVCSYVGIDPILNPVPSVGLPLRSDGCAAKNISFYMSTISPIAKTTVISSLNSTFQSKNNDRLALSYLHYATLALIVSLVVGIIVSAITRFNKGRKVDERTYYKYSWFCSQYKALLKYDVNYSNVNVSQKQANNSDKQDNKENGEHYSDV